MLNHGTFSNYRSVRGIAGFLSERGYHCWILDCQGHGYSDKPSVVPDFEGMYLDDAAAALEYVSERSIKPVWWVGHSGGGLAILMLLTRKPDLQKKLAGLVTVASQTTDAGQGLLKRMCWLGAILLTKVIGFTPGRLVRIGPENEFGQVMLQWFRWSLRGKWVGADQFDYLEHLQAITIPALTIAAGGDHVIAPASGCEKIHQALGSSQKQYTLASTANGFLENYNHARVISSRNASKDVWPLVSDWIETHSQDVFNSKLPA